MYVIYRVCRSSPEMRIRSILLIKSDLKWCILWHFLYSVGPHPVASVHIYPLLCRGHSWWVRLAKQETLTPPGHLVSPLVYRVRECPPWCSIVGATVTVHQFFCWVELSWIGCLTSQLTIFQSYMWRHIDVQADLLVEVSFDCPSSRQSSHCLPKPRQHPLRHSSGV